MASHGQTGDIPNHRAPYRDAPIEHLADQSVDGLLTRFAVCFGMIPPLTFTTQGDLVNLGGCKPVSV